MSYPVFDVDSRLIKKQQIAVRHLIEYRVPAGMLHCVAHIAVSHHSRLRPCEVVLTFAAEPDAYIIGPLPRTAKESSHQVTIGQSLNSSRMARGERCRVVKELTAGLSVKDFFGDAVGRLLCNKRQTEEKRYEV